LPHLAEVTIDEIHEADGRIVIEARSGRDQAACPDCGTGSARVHGRYHRRLADTALAGRPVVIRLLMRRLVCREARDTLLNLLRAAPLPQPGTVTALGVDDVRDFADLMNKHRGDRLPDWMLRVQADNLPALHSLVTGLRRDLAAVTAGLGMIWSSGPVEGAVNRIKTIKRSMYGRAGFELLRRRILLSA
jgi:transposase